MVLYGNFVLDGGESMPTLVATSMTFFWYAKVVDTGSSCTGSGLTANFGLGETASSAGRTAGVAAGAVLAANSAACSASKVKSTSPGVPCRASTVSVSTA